MQGAQGPQGAPGVTGTLRGARTIPFTCVRATVLNGLPAFTAFAHRSGDMVDNFTACATTMGSDGGTVTAFSLYVQDYGARIIASSVPVATRFDVWLADPVTGTPVPAPGYTITLPASVTLVSGYFTPDDPAPSPLDILPGTRVSIGVTADSAQSVFITSDGIAGSVRL